MGTLSAANPSKAGSRSAFLAKRQAAHHSGSSLKKSPDPQRKGNSQEYGDCS